MDPEKMMLKQLCIVISITAIPLSVTAEGFDLLSRLDEIKKAVIVEAGDAEFLAAPFGSIGNMGMVKVSNYCFEPAGRISGWSYGKRAVLILVDSRKNLKLALLENGIGSVKLTTISVAQVGCP
jgi:hypothetical protein